MSGESDGDRERHLNWLAARLRVPVERVAEAAAWQSYAGPSDSLDLLELAFRLEAELGARRDAPKAPSGG
jgi:acyl carrier protein